MNNPWGFAVGVITGSLLTTIALLIGGVSEPGSYVDQGSPLIRWLSVNLGHSTWLFAVVFTLYALNLDRLNRLLDHPIQSNDVVELDQLSDVWIHLFVGIGVIWTAVGMRSALQAALGDPADALTDSAGNVLRKLVDGGILLALTTTIVGAIGGYLMRLGKTLLVGARLQSVYDLSHQQPMRELISATERIESRLGGSREAEHAT